MHASLADVLTDLVQNSVEADSDRVTVVLDEGDDVIRISVEDNGPGMDEATLAKAEDPFWSDGVKHPGRRVGLGLPFLKQTAQQCGGRAELVSRPGLGTRVEGSFPADHWDRPPLGDVVLLWVQCLTLDGAKTMSIRRIRRWNDGRVRSYEIERDEVSEALGGLDDAGALGLLRDYVRSLEDEITST